MKPVAAGHIPGSAPACKSASWISEVSGIINGNDKANILGCSDDNCADSNSDAEPVKES